MVFCTLCVSIVKKIHLGHIQLIQVSWDITYDTSKSTCVQLECNPLGFRKSLVTAPASNPLRNGGHYVWVIKHCLTLGGVPLLTLQSGPHQRPSLRIYKDRDKSMNNAIRLLLQVKLVEEGDHPVVNNHF